MTEFLDSWSQIPGRTIARAFENEDYNALHFDFTDGTAVEFRGTRNPALTVAAYVPSDDVFSVDEVELETLVGYRITSVTVTFVSYPQAPPFRVVLEFYNQRDSVVMKSEDHTSEFGLVKIDGEDIDVVV